MPEPHPYTFDPDWDGLCATCGGAQDDPIHHTNKEHTMTTADQDRALDEIFARPDVLTLDIEVVGDIAFATDQLDNTFVIQPDGRCPKHDLPDFGADVDADAFSLAQHAAAKDDPRYLRGH